MSGDGVGNGVREFWLCGEPNELDVGVWYDTHPGTHIVTGKEFFVHHVVEFSAYEAVVKERDEVIIARDILIKDWLEALAKMALMSGEIDQLLRDRKNLMDEAEVLKAEIEQCGAHR